MAIWSSEIKELERLCELLKDNFPELGKALEIYQKWRIRPLWSVNYTNLGNEWEK